MVALSTLECLCILPPKYHLSLSQTIDYLLIAFLSPITICYSDHIQTIFLFIDFPYILSIINSLLCYQIFKRIRFLEGLMDITLYFSICFQKTISSDL